MTLIAQGGITSHHEPVLNPYKQAIFLRQLAIKSALVTGAIRIIVLL
jgi:hypothetical protein